METPTRQAGGVLRQCVGLLPCQRLLADLKIHPSPLHSCVQCCYALSCNIVAMVCAVLCCLTSVALAFSVGYTALQFDIEVPQAKKGKNSARKEEVQVCPRVHFPGSLHNVLMALGNVHGLVYTECACLCNAKVQPQRIQL